MTWELVICVLIVVDGRRERTTRLNTTRESNAMLFSFCITSIGMSHHCNRKKTVVEIRYNNVASSTWNRWERNLMVTHNMPLSWISCIVSQIRHWATFQFRKHQLKGITSENTSFLCSSPPGAIVEDTKGKCFRKVYIISKQMVLTSPIVSKTDGGYFKLTLSTTLFFSTSTSQYPITCSFTWSCTQN